MTPRAAAPPEPSAVPQAETVATSVGGPHVAVPRTEPGVLDGFSLLGQMVEEVIVRTIHDTHVATVGRIYDHLPQGVRGISDPVGTAHRLVTRTGYTAAEWGLRAASFGLRTAADLGLGADLEGGPRGRFVRSATNGLIGHRLVDDHERMAIDIAVRRDGADVPLTPAGLAAAYPDATERVVVFVPGLCEGEDYWDFRKDPVVGSYPEQLTELGWTPVLVRVNSGLSLRENGVHFSALLQELVEHWPAGRPRLALIGHSMGGLIIRAATAVHLDAEQHPTPWTGLVSDVITLGTPHLGAPLARGISRAANGLARWPETAPLGRVLDQLSHGIDDLTVGLSDEVPSLPGAKYHTVVGTVTKLEHSLVGRWLGDLLVSPGSARGHVGEVQLFPGATVLHVPSTEHLSLLNHPSVARGLREWLG